MGTLMPVVGYSCEYSKTIGIVYKLLSNRNVSKGSSN